MAFRLKNKGVEIYLDITHYPKNDTTEWCKTDFNFKSRDDINVVRKNVEAFLGFEILDIEQFLTEYLDYDLEDGAYYECIEPGFSFRVDDEIVVLEVEIYHNCRISTSLNREEVEKLRDYLRQVIDKKAEF